MTVAQQFIQSITLYAVSAIVNYTCMVLICVETNWPSNLFEMPVLDHELYITGAR